MDKIGGVMMFFDFKCLVFVFVISIMVEGLDIEMFNLGGLFWKRLYIGKLVVLY